MMVTIATSFAVSPLRAGLPFGVRISGLERSHLQDEAIRNQLLDLWIQHGVILFRDGESSQEMQLELSRCFGALEPHPFPETHTGRDNDLVKIKFYPEDGTYYEINGDVRGGWLPWHSDLIYTSRINRGGILRPAQLPRTGGMTGFVDQIAAYERLSPDLRERIEGLHVVYEVEINMALMRFIDAGDIRIKRLASSGAAIEKRKFTYPRVVHPMVFTQQETGRKVLNVSPAFALGIYEMGGIDGDALLREVIAVCTDPALAYFHDWRSDDMVLWDNWRILHSAQGVPMDETRVMERTTIAGDYALGRALGHGTLVDFDV